MRSGILCQSLTENISGCENEETGSSQSTIVQPGNTAGKNKTQNNQSRREERIG